MNARTAVVLLSISALTSSAAAWSQRDGTAAVIAQGTATLSGVVVDEPGGTAVRRAVVTVQGSGGPATRGVVTDDDGRFVVRNLPAGRYSVVARKAAYLDAAYGAKRPGRPGTAVSLDDAGTVDVTIRMARGAVVEGILRGEDGDPIPATTVYALSPDEPGMLGPTALSRQQATATTDDRGVYRIYGLTPGEYIIASVFSPTGDGEIGRYADAAVDALLDRLAGSAPGQPTSIKALPHPPAPAIGYAPTYYPGTTLFGDAARVRVVAGEERRGLDFTLAPVPTVVMEGAVVGDPQRLAAVQLSFVTDGVRSFVGGSRPILTQRPGPDGRFRYTSVPPGRYTIYARSDPGAAVPGRGGGPVAVGGRGGGGRVSGPGATGPRDPWFAVAEVAVFGQDVSGISLVLQPGVTVSGRIQFASAAPPGDVTTVRVSLSNPGGSYMSSSADGTVTGNALVGVGSPAINPDGTFEATGVAPGGYELRSTIPSDTERVWWLRSAMLDGRDLLDEPLEVRTRSVSGIVVTFTDRVNELTGTFQTASGQPVSDYYVVAIPDDRSLWRAGSRRLASTRPATDGRFSLTRLPAGAYRLAALTDFEPSDFADEAFLEALASQGIAVTIRDGEPTVQDIRVAQ